MTDQKVLLTVKAVSKSFGENEVLKSLSLDVYEGEFLTLLGPSGCGKTTLLRLIAGLEEPTAGSVHLDGADMTSQPPEKRPLNTVFQNYALFPHMNVAQNVAYGLKIRRTPKKEIAQKVDEALSLVQLAGYGKRTPAQLSGGQRQRVAIARAIVLAPRLLLLDEPLGALDLQLRRQMQQELKRLQKALGINFIYVTHDQEEALNMSDRIAVMREGRICQLGTPQEIYEHPNSMFTAQFIGQTNLLHAGVASSDDKRLTLDLAGRSIPAQSYWQSFAPGERVCLSVRMERVRYGLKAQHDFALPAVLEEKQYTGGSQRIVLTLEDGQRVTCMGDSHYCQSIAVGQHVSVWWEQSGAAVVPEEAQA